MGDDMDDEDFTLKPLSVGHVVVKRDVFEDAKAGNEAAVVLLQAELDGIVLYDHGYHMHPDEIVVSIQDLISLGVITEVRIGTGITWF